MIYPPVDIENIKPLKKKKYILSVGRFFSFLKDKKQEFLIEAFRQLYENKKAEEWSLILVGSAGEGDMEYVEKLKDLAKGLPVNFYPNLRYDELIRLYGQSCIYWHAAGFNEEDPTKMEHFGISTVEAMAGGVVPVVIGKGGQLEIVKKNVSGFLWQSMEGMNKYTEQLIEDEDLMKKISKEAIKRARNFSKEKFKQSILDICK